MKTQPKTLAGAINPFFAGVVGLISLGVVLLGWEWHSAHPGKHATEHQSSSASKHAEKAAKTETEDKEDAAGSDPATTTTTTTPATPGASKKHHKHKH